MKQKLEELLKHHFNFSTFKPGQKEVVTSVLEGHDTVAVLPTGTGKSLCYQLPAYALPGSVVIVSPLLSLMQDQVEQMQMRGEKRVIAINSFLNQDEKRVIFNRLHQFKFIFLSPEMLNRNDIQKRLQQMQVSLFVIDEAHCISQWGYDFRPAYMKLGTIRGLLGNPLTLVLTATATREVVNDIVASLHLKKWKEYLFSVDRPNIAIKVEELEDTGEKERRLLELVSTLQGPGIIYFSSRKKAEATVQHLLEQGIPNVMAYHGGMEQENRILIQQQFIHGQLDIICATSAFGMGVNKENIRFIIHYHMPLQLESYLQEIGRAGRDGASSIAILLYSQGDENLAFHLVEGELPNELQVGKIKQWVMEGGSSIKEHEEEIRSMAGLNEVQWRVTCDFMDSLQSEGIVMDQCLVELENFISSRINLKREKINQIKNWTNSPHCRREKILNYFAEEKKMKIENCCDICGLEMRIFKKAEENKELEQYPFVWKDYLSAILLKE